MNSDGSDVRLQRRNLVQMVRLASKRLIESGINSRHQLTEVDVPVQQFCIIIEHILRHGLKSRRGFFGPKTGSFWPFLCETMAQSDDAMQSLETLKCLPQLKTDIAMCRAWIRLSLMEKRLSERFDIMLDPKNILVRQYYYEPLAVMCNEDGHLVAGLLIGVTAIDANLDLKDGDMEGVGLIDFSLYMTDGNMYKDNDSKTGNTASEDKEGSTEQDRFVELMNQKNFSDEAASKFRLQLEDARQSMKAYETKVRKLEADLSTVTNDRDMMVKRLVEAQERSGTKIQQLKKEKKVVQSRLTAQVQALQAALDNMKKQFATEMTLRQDVERELAAINGLLIDSRKKEAAAVESQASQEPPALTEDLNYF